MEKKSYKLNSVVEMKKKHPCGESKWNVTRVGADIKIKCEKCDHSIMMDRVNFDKKIKKIVEY